MKLRDALELYQTYFRPLNDTDRLSFSDYLDAGDWSGLERLLEVLSPLKHASLRLQAGNNAKHALWEQLATFDNLLGKFERLKERYIYEPSSHIKACISLRWKKLGKYYGMLDKTSAYIMTVFLHLHLMMTWFEMHWGCWPPWIDAAETAIDDAYTAAETKWSSDAQKAILLNHWTRRSSPSQYPMSITPCLKMSTRWTTYSFTSERSGRQDCTRLRRWNGGVRTLLSLRCCDIWPLNSLRHRPARQQMKEPSPSPATRSGRQATNSVRTCGGAAASPQLVRGRHDLGYIDA